MDRFEILKELLIANRSVRRFDEAYRIAPEKLEALVELTRFCASGRNLQPLRYRIVHTPEECERLFPALAWAGYYTDWNGPEPGERPAAYLVQCLDTELTKNCQCDDGLQLEAITLGAVSMGLEGCIIKAFNKEVLTEALNLPGQYEPRYVLALGRAAEKVKLVDMAPDGNYKYYHDATGTHCVPKRLLGNLIIH